MSEQDLSQFSMLDLFRVEAETQALVLTSGLLALERDPALADQLEACMRAAHSLKGAARIVGLAVGVRVAHAMEDCFVAAQQGQLTLRTGAHRPAARRPPICWRASPTPRRQTSASGRARRKPKSTQCLASLAGILAGDDVGAGRRWPAARAGARAAGADDAAEQDPSAPSRAARLRPGAARLGGKPESPAEPGG